MFKVERICLSCGKSSLINKSSYASNYCRPCSLKIENRFRHMSWEQIQKLLKREYERGLKDARKSMRSRLLQMIFTDFPFLKQAYENERSV